VTEENPQPTKPDDAEQIWNLPVDTEERRKLAETAQSVHFQPQDGQPTGQPFPGDPAQQQAIWNLPVDTEERRKLAESEQSLHFQHVTPESDAE
jgi:hypothetical protein